MVGIPDCADWQCGWCGHFIFDWPNYRAALAATSSRKVERPARLGAGGRTRRLEAYSSQSIASALSHQLDELFVWPDQNSLPYLHDLDRYWPGAGAFSLCLSWDVGSTGLATRSRTDSSASIRILGLGRRAARFLGDSGADGSYRNACAPK